MAQDDPWKDVHTGDADFVREIWPRLFGEQLQDDISKESPLYKNVRPSPFEGRVRRHALFLRILLDLGSVQGRPISFLTSLVASERSLGARRLFTSVSIVAKQSSRLCHLFGAHLSMGLVASE